jgi:hypothetical protein
MTEDYKIIRDREGWTVRHSGPNEGSYATKEAAFEAAVGAASSAIHNGRGITITVEGAAAGESNLGAS